MGRMKDMAIEQMNEEQQNHDYAGCCRIIS